MTTTATLGTLIERHGIEVEDHLDRQARIFDEPVRVLLCTNGTPERDGVRRRFGLTVPGSIQEPVAAAAWTFDLGPSEYRLLERAT